MNHNLNNNSLRDRLLTTVGADGLKISSSVAMISAAGLLAVFTAQPAQALHLYDGSNYGNNLEINLNIATSYSGIFRINSPSQILEGPTNANGNDGDTNSQHGLVSNLFEIVPTLDIKDGNYGAHFSGQGYLNTAYLKTNQNGQAGTLNSIFLNKSNDFTSATRNVNGENAQLLDAFVYGGHQFNNGGSVQLKFGRQVLFWGQSLFFPTSGISGGQAPINVVTADAAINPQSQQVFMPTGQAVLTYQPGVYGLTFQGYYQFEWEHDYFEGAGAYFNGADYLDKGAQSVIFGNTGPAAGNLNEYAFRNKDLDPEHQNGQFGISVQGQVGLEDWGLFVERFDAKAPEVYAYPGQGGVFPFSTNVVPVGLHVAQYALVYPRDIWLQGASLSGNVGAANVAGEISGREHMPLIPSGFGIPTPGNPGNANNDPLYPVGDIVNAQASGIYVSPGIPLDPGGVTLEGEVDMSHLVSVTQNRAALVVGHQATSGAFHFVISPEYYSVLPHLDVAIPVGIVYDFLGRSQFDASQYHGVGTFNIGISGTYKTNWIATVSYQDYLGKPDTSYNGIADRGYASINLQHTF